VIVEGAIVDADGPRTGYVRFRGNRVTEVGAIGTDSTRGRQKRIRGIVLPAPVNGHTHLGDAVSDREPPNAPMAEIVAPPNGLKFRLLRDTPPPAKVRAMRGALQRMERESIAVTLDFREEGLEGIRQLRAASRGLTTRPFILGRPLQRPIDVGELGRVVRAADGIGLSSTRDEAPADRRAVARAAHAAAKPFAVHASEQVRESPEEYLALHPDLLIHLTRATRSDLERVARSGATVAVCPRSNGLFGLRPPLSDLDRLGIPTLLGTDNLMFNAPSMLRELEFAYVSSRMQRRPISASFLVRAAFVNGWHWLRKPDSARVEPGVRPAPVAFRLPPEDPEYQIVTRAAEHLMIHPETRSD